MSEENEKMTLLALLTKAVSPIMPMSSQTSEVDPKSAINEERLTATTRPKVARRHMIWDTSLCMFTFYLDADIVQNCVRIWKTHYLQVVSVWRLAVCKLSISQPK